MESQKSTRTRNRGGRKKKKEEEKITGNIPVYVTDQERMAFKLIYSQKASSASKRGLSALIKQVFLSFGNGETIANPGGHFQERDVAILKSIRSQLGIPIKSLKSISDNFNQFLKRANSIPNSNKLLHEFKKEEQLLKDLRSTLEVLYILLDKLHNILDNKPTSEQSKSESRK